MTCFVCTKGQHKRSKPIKSSKTSVITHRSPHIQRPKIRPDPTDRQRNIRTHARHRQKDTRVLDARTDITDQDRVPHNHPHAPKQNERAAGHVPVSREAARHGRNKSQHVRRRAHQVGRRAHKVQVRDDGRREERKRVQRLRDRDVHDCVHVRAVVGKRLTDLVPGKRHVGVGDALRFGEEVVPFLGFCWGEDLVVVGGEVDEQPPAGDGGDERNKAFEDENPAPAAGGGDALLVRQVAKVFPGREGDVFETVG